MLIALLVPLAAGLFFLLGALVPIRRLRGVGVTIVIMAHCLAWSLVVPQNVRDAVIAATVTLLLLLAVGPRAVPSPRSTRTALLPLTLLLFGCTIATTFVTNPDGVGLLLRLGSLAGLLVIVVQQSTRDDILAMRRGLVVNTTIQVVLGLVELLVTHRPVLWGYKDYGVERNLNNANHLLGDSLVRIQGSLSHPIPFAAVVLCGLLVLIVDWRRYRQGLNVILLALFVSALVLSGSRSVILAGALSVAFVTITSKSVSSQWRRPLFLLLGFAVVLVNSDSIVAQVDSLVDSGSFSNRQGSISSIPALLQRPFWETLWGSGAATQPRLFASGLLVSNGLNVIDNQLVTTLATQGVIGVLLLVAILRTGFRSGDLLARGMILMMGVMLFSFDYMVLTSMVSILFVFLACPRLDSQMASASAAAGVRSGDHAGAVDSARRATVRSGTLQTQLSTDVIRMR